MTADDDPHSERSDTSPAQARTGRVRSLRVWSVGLAGFAIAGGLLVAAISGARQVGRRGHCTCHARHITLALQTYHSTYNAYPPAYLPDKDGKPAHSWRVLLLPYFEAQGLYDQYDFSEPWNGPKNRRLWDKMPDVFRCPSAKGDLHETNYVAVVGPKTVWPGVTSISMGDIPDGTSNTILVVEVVDSGINWLEPRDLTFEQAVGGINRGNAHMGISSNHRGGALVGFCDGHVHFLHNDTPTDVLRSLLTRAGGEQIPMLD